MSDAVMEVLDFTKMISSPTTFSLSAKRAATRRGMTMADGLSEVAAFAAIRRQLNGSMQGVQFSPNEQVQQLDRDYLAAVEAGDMETAQRIVDEAAKLAGYLTLGYHASKEPINIFDLGKSSSGFWFADNERAAKTFVQWRNSIKKPFITRAYLKMENPEKYEDFWYDFLKKVDRGVTNRREWREGLQSRGRDSAVIGEDRWLDADMWAEGEQFVTFNPNQITHLLKLRMTNPHQLMKPLQLLIYLNYRKPTV